MISGLNTLRYFAFLSVFLFHAGGDFFSWGLFGVEFFFVLSAFLLTNLALGEFRRTGRINNWNFFMRRSLRIFPLYFFFLLIIFVMLPLVGLMFDKTVASSNNGWMYFSFLANFDTSESIYPLKFLWSISVEEQFYLFFGLVGIFLLRTRVLTVLLLSVLLISYFLYVFLSDVPGYMHTLSQLPNFVVGIAAGYVYFHYQKIHPVILMTLLFVSFGAICFVEQEWLLYPIMALFFGSVIFTCIQYWHWLDRLRIFKFTEYWGGYTYGLYVYSGLMILFGWFVMPQGHLLVSVAVFILLHAVAWMSFELFEKRFLGLKKKFRT